ncbi:MAG: SDR family NAD(P)-dependent oxidoreductase [Planctomycetes bacterium]|nr:SDR family NAD(P)-dependent oxidoreductase [Planctomycetota bacterium]
MGSSRVVLVTGASSGIGRAVCLAYAKRGAAVVAMARTEGKLVALAREIESSGGRASISVGDVGRKEDVRAAVAVANKNFGGLDTAIANAGFGIYADVERITEEDFDAIVRTNIKGVLWTLQESLPHLRAARGRFAIVSSILGRASVPYSALYCMTKHALTALADSARLELAKDGISVTVVGPALTATDFQINAPSRMGGVPSPANTTGWSPEKVAGKLVAAVERRRREAYLTFSGRALIWMRNHFPGIADWGVRQWMKGHEKRRGK